MEARRMLPNDWTMGQLCYSIISLWLCSLASQDLFIARKQFSKGIIFQGPQKHSHNQYLSFDHFYGNIYNLLCLLKHADGIMQKKNTRSLAFEPRTWDPALVKIRSKKWRFEKTSANYLSDLETNLRVLISVHFQLQHTSITVKPIHSAQIIRVSSLM